MEVRKQQGHHNEHSIIVRTLPRVFSFLDASSLLIVSVTCKAIRANVVQGEESNELWRNLWIWNTPYRTYSRDRDELATKSELENGVSVSFKHNRIVVTDHDNLEAECLPRLMNNFH